MTASFIYEGKEIDSVIYESYMGDLPKKNSYIWIDGTHYFIHDFTLLDTRILYLLLIK